MLEVFYNFEKEYVILDQGWLTISLDRDMILC